MVTDEELDGLPTDPELAFVAIERLLRTKLEKREFQARNNDLDMTSSYVEYMTAVHAAVQVYKIEALSGLTVPSVS